MDQRLVEQTDDPLRLVQAIGDLMKTKAMRERNPAEVAAVNSRVIRILPSLLVGRENEFGKPCPEGSCKRFENTNGKILTPFSIAERYW